MFMIRDYRGLGHRCLSPHCFPERTCFAFPHLLQRRMLAPALSKEEELHWLALRLIPGLGTRKAGKLVARFHTAQAIFRASRSELEASGLPGGIAQTISSGCTFEDAVDQQQKMLDTGATLISLTDPRYPPRLRDIFDPPV